MQFTKRDPLSGTFGESSSVYLVIPFVRRPSVSADEKEFTKKSSKQV